MTTTVYLALGSNLGDRRSNLDAALAQVRALPNTQVVAVSTYHETLPVGCPPDAGAFLNAAAELQTLLGPRELLQQLQRIEQEMGRVRSEPNASRPLDLDILFYGDQILDETGPPALQVPHPRLHLRTFVLHPLAEIAPDLTHRVLKRTIRELLASLHPERERLKGKRTLVTGSTSGIGLAIAKTLAAAGATVIIHGRRSRQRAEEAAKQCSIFGQPAQVAMADLRMEKDRQTLIDTAWNSLGGLDIVVNNAGADTLTGEAGKWSFERKLEELWAVDVQATLHLSRAFGEKMRATGGVILTIGWDQAETGMEGDSGQLFAAVKGAIMAFTRSLAKSLAPTVRVNCIAPGWIKTAWGETASGYWHDRVMQETPLKRWGTPIDVAQTALWLVSQEAEFITGQIVRVNGGVV